MSMRKSAPNSAHSMGSILQRARESEAGHLSPCPQAKEGEGNRASPGSSPQVLAAERE